MNKTEHWLLPEGIAEVLPPQAQTLEKMRRELLDLFYCWGYELVMPPLIEYLESLLTGTGGDLDLRTFKVTDQISGRTMGIRADITPQAARIDAHQLRRTTPTRLCYLGSVLNTRSSGFSGSRSPLQVGGELYGHAGVESDHEIISLMIQTLQQAGLKDLYMDLGHVGIFRGLSRQAGLDKQQEHALFDTLQRKAVPEIESLLSEFDIAENTRRMLAELPHLSGDDALIRAREVLADANEDVISALEQLERLSSLLAERRPELPVHYDLAELRGYHYHTGVVFAAFVPGVGEEVARGGRYDDIGRVFGRARPACGFSADLKQLFQLCTVEDDKQVTGILAPLSEDPALRNKIDELRSLGHRVINVLPGQSGGPREMGCGEILEKQGDDWVVVAV
ncbi:MAG: ATP phosphoribosyltransferase regulatory subunit [Candidatus Sedimenticola sp. (ex Thyasira tokunagai)]